VILKLEILSDILYFICWSVLTVIYVVLAYIVIFLRKLNKSKWRRYLGIKVETQCLACWSWAIAEHVTIQH